MGYEAVMREQETNHFYVRIGGHDEAEGLVTLSLNVISIFDPRFQLLLSFLTKFEISDQRRNFML